MSNDDICFIGSLAHVKIIDVCCPRQFLSVARWIAGGGRGLVYLRVMRNASPALYPEDYEFEYGKAQLVRREKDARIVIVSSGHGVIEALRAAELLSGDGIPVSVADMPSYDGAFLRDAVRDGQSILFAEQNNGALYDRWCRDIVRHGISLKVAQITAMNTRDADDNLRFIQSGTYDQIAEALDLSAPRIADAVKRLVRTEVA
jgi:transketolase C-terminal domain/subunit